MSARDLSIFKHNNQDMYIHFFKCCWSSKMNSSCNVSRSFSMKEKKTKIQYFCSRVSTRHSRKHLSWFKTWSPGPNEPNILKTLSSNVCITLLNDILSKWIEQVFKKFVVLTSFQTQTKLASADMNLNSKKFSRMQRILSCSVSVNQKMFYVVA